MDLISLCIVWYILGLIGCTLGTLSDLSDGCDFTVSDMIMNLVIASFGAVTLILGFIAYVTNTNVGKFNKILIKGKK